MYVDEEVAGCERIGYLCLHFVSPSLIIYRSSKGIKIMLHPRALTSSDASFSFAHSILPYRCFQFLEPRQCPLCRHIGTSNGYIDINRKCEVHKRDYGMNSKDLQLDYSTTHGTAVLRRQSLIGYIRSNLLNNTSSHS